jgi:hypothetical protein
MQWEARVLGTTKFHPKAKGQTQFRKASREAHLRSNASGLSPFHHPKRLTGQWTLAARFHSQH